jgi:hypothetical protein
LGETKIGNFMNTIVDENIGGFDVTVDDVFG